VEIQSRDRQFELERIHAAPGPAHHRHPDVAGFWEALDAGHLALQACSDCKTLRFPIATHCYRCLSGEFHWEPIDPVGAVDVAIEIHEAVSELPASGASLPEPWRSIAPYFTGAVEMTSGIRLPGRLVCVCGGVTTRGTSVRAVLLPAADGSSVYGFAHTCIATGTRGIDE
jgi:uncharacterized OB-fold protein